MLFHERAQPFLRVIRRKALIEARRIIRVSRVSPSTQRMITRSHLTRISPKTLSLPLYTHRPVGPEAISRSVTNLVVSEFFFSGDIRSFDLVPALSKLECPTLITARDLDLITSLANSEDIAAGIPSGLAYLKRFSGAGHGVQHDQPERFFFCCANLSPPKIRDHSSRRYLRLRHSPWLRTGRRR